MDLNHTFIVSAPIDVAWATMMDLQSVAECFPGAAVTSTEGDRFEGTCKVKLGPIALVYKGAGSSNVTTHATGPSSRPRARTNGATAPQGPPSPSP